MWCGMVWCVLCSAVLCCGVVCAVWRKTAANPLVLVCCQTLRHIRLGEILREKSAEAKLIVV